HHLLAVVSQAPGKYLVPARLALIDPLRHRVLRSLPFDGDVLSWAQTPAGRALFLVSRIGKIAPARLVIAGLDGRTRTVRSSTPIPGGFCTSSGASVDFKLRKECS